MNKIAKFEKVSLEQFKKVKTDNYTDAEWVDIYNNISLPQRATVGSTGYDFKSPFDFTLNPGETILIPTGIRCKMENEYVLMIFPRSGLGFKYRLQLDNTVGIIDADYYYSDNEGHIMCKITNDTHSNKVLEVKAGSGICQGIFMQYGITIDDSTTAVRNGGFGSTDKK